MGANSKKYDFSGWATKNDLKCSDGRTIRHNAFKHNDGKTVPLVWQHCHNDPENVLGHCDLENRSEGVYCWGVFNSTPAGIQAKALVEHGDVNALSIWANGLDQRGGDVYHGDIKEVSLVLAGANPGALIDYPIIEHSGEESYDEAVIYTGDVIHSDEERPMEKAPEQPTAEEPKKDEPKKDEELEHSDDPTIQEVFDTLTEVQKNAVYAIIAEALGGDDDELEQSEDLKDDEALEHSDGPTIKEVFGTLTDVQKDAVYAILAEALPDDEKDDEINHSEEGGTDTMKTNVFDAATSNQVDVLSHDDFMKIMADAKRLGSLKDAVLQHMEEGGILAHTVNNDTTPPTAQTYGIANINYMFPDARNVDQEPYFISRNMDWVSKVINGTHHTPFSRVKSLYADITMEEARALGYTKGNPKKEEVFKLLKRTTDPQTIYKKQKMDRDDIIDITDFNVVAWLKREMRMMLDEEVARAILIGDGRSAASDDKISEDHIHPVLTDADLYTIKKTVTAGADDDETAKNFIRAIIKSRKEYKGSGSPTLYTTEDVLTDMLLLEDKMGRALYETEAALATKLRVKEIVTVQPMEDLDQKTAILVNLSDYNVGADRGGEINMFDDFDIDYNQQKYLIETRISGALVRPYSAIAFTVGSASAGGGAGAGGNGQS